MALHYPDEGLNEKQRTMLVRRSTWETHKQSSRETERQTDRQSESCGRVRDKENNTAQVMSEKISSNEKRRETTKNILRNSKTREKELYNEMPIRKQTRARTESEGKMVTAKSSRSAADNHAYAWPSITLAQWLCVLVINLNYPKVLPAAAVYHLTCLSVSLRFGLWTYMYICSCCGTVSRRCTWCYTVTWGYSWCYTVTRGWYAMA